VPSAIRHRIVRLWLADVSGDLRGVELAHVERVLELAAAGREGGRAAVPGGTVTLRAGNLAWNLRSADGSPPPQPLEVGSSVTRPRWRITARASARRLAPGPWRAVFDRGALGDRGLRVRAPAPGDRVRPLRLGGSKKLQDVFVDAKVPRIDRAGWPVVEATDGEILWVPGLVRGERAPIAPSTRRYLVLEATRR
jgi:tRNA(Ile)-lysidine synthase